jgi:hypothetical protein
MLNYRIFTFVIIILICSTLQAQDTSLYGLRLYRESNPEPISAKKLIFIDSVFNKIQLEDDLLFYMNTNLGIDLKLTKVINDGFYKIYTYYDTSNVFAKRKYAYRCLKRKNQGKSMQFQLLLLGKNFYVVYNYNKRKAEDTYVIDTVKIKMPIGSFGLSCAIEDSASKYLFLFTDFDRPQFDTNPPKDKQPPWTFGDYKTIVILNERSKPCALITIHKNLIDAHVILMNEQGFYESKMAITWGKVKEYTLNEWVTILKNMPKPDKTSKSFGKEMYKKDWQSWGEAYRYQIHWDKNK